MPETAQDAWDTIDDDSKHKILSYAMKRGAKDASNGLSVNQAEVESNNDSPDVTDESGIIFECSNLEIHEGSSESLPAPAPPVNPTLKTAKEHNEDLLLTHTPKTSNKSTKPDSSSKKGPTPPLDQNDPVTDGLRLLEDPPPPQHSTTTSESKSVSTADPKIDPVALEIHQLLSVKPLSPAQKAQRVQQNTNLNGGSLPEYFDANFCEIDMHSRDFTPMICNAEMEVGNSVDIEISMAEQYDSDDDDDLAGVLNIPNLAQLIIPTSSDTTTRTDGGQ